MAYQEKRTLMGLFTSLTIFVFYGYQVWQRYLDADFSTMTEWKFWGMAMIIMVPVSIVGNIIAHILFSIVYAIGTREKLPDKDDERDKLIELKSTRNGLVGFIMGFFLAMSALAMDYEPTTMFIIIAFGGLFSEVVSSMSKMYYYRRGI